jgi:hypothetical protein
MEDISKEDFAEAINRALETVEDEELRKGAATMVNALVAAFNYEVNARCMAEFQLGSIMSTVLTNKPLIMNGSRFNLIMQWLHDTSEKGGSASMPLAEIFKKSTVLHNDDYALQLQIASKKPRIKL